MNKLAIGDVTITSIIERDGPWRTPEEMFPKYDPEIGRRHLAELDREVFDPASGKMVITYQTYVVRTPKHTVLIDTCTGEDKGYPLPKACASRTSTTCFAPICISTIPAGTPSCAMAAGSRPFPKPNTSSTNANMPHGRNRPSAAKPEPPAVAMCGGSIASPWSRPIRRSLSTTISRSTTHFG